MSIKIEKTENANELKLSFEVEAEKFDEAIKTVYKKSAKYINIPGFRKGKAPMAIVEKHYGPEIFYEDAFNEIVPEIYEKELKENNIEAVSKPNLDVEQIGKGQNLKFTAVVQIKPEVKLGKYKGIELKKVEYNVSDEDIEKELNSMAERNARMVSVDDRAVENGDITVIDFEGTVDGVKFDGGTAEGHELEIGSGSFIPGFEDQVIGMKIDEEKDVKVKFPDDYFSEELKGKDAIFKVKLHEIKKKELPAIDDEFAKDTSEFETLAELKNSIKEKLEETNKSKAKYETEEAAIKAVCDDTKIDIPSGMIDTELDNMVKDIETRLSYQGMNMDMYLSMIGKTMDEFRKEGEEQAIEAVKTRLVLEKLIKDEKIEADKKQIEEKLEEMAKVYGRKKEELEKNEAFMEYLTKQVEQETAIEFLVSNAKIK